MVLNQVKLMSVMTCDGYEMPDLDKQPITCLLLTTSRGSVAGYTGDGRFCTDVDECVVNNGGCSMSPRVQCVNTIGSRTCGDCPAGACP